MQACKHACKQKGSKQAKSKHACRKQTVTSKQPADSSNQEQSSSTQGITKQ